MSLKKLAGETAIYGISSIFGRLLNFALTPYLTNMFLPSEYAVYTLLYSGIAFAFVFYTYRFELAYFRFAADKSENKDDIFNLSLTSIVVSAVVLSFVLFAAAPSLASFWEIENQTNLIYLCAGILAIDAVNEIPKAKLRQESRPIRFAVVQLSFIIINFVSVFFFLWICPLILESETLQFLHPIIKKIYYPEFGIGYVFVANIIGSIIAFILLLPEWRHFKILIDKVLWSKMMGYAFPLVIVGFSYIINEMFDRTFMIKLLPGTPEENKDALGIYGGVYKLAVIMGLFTQAFRYGAEPFFFKQKNQSAAYKSYADVAKYFFIISLFAFLIISLYLDFFKYFIPNPKYWEGLGVVPILLMANLFSGMYYNFSVWFKITDRTKYGAYISVGGAGITILLNLWWLPIFGYTGAAWATLICYSSMAIACVLIGRRFLTIPYEFKRLIIYLAGGIGVFFLAAFAEQTMPENLWLSTGVNTICLLLFVVLVWQYEKKELKRIITR